LVKDAKRTRHKKLHSKTLISLGSVLKNCRQNEFDIHRRIKQHDRSVEDEKRRQFTLNRVQDNLTQLDTVKKQHLQHMLELKNRADKYDEREEKQAVEDYRNDNGGIDKRKIMAWELKFNKKRRLATMGKNNNATAFKGIEFE